MATTSKNRHQGRVTPTTRTETRFKRGLRMIAEDSSNGDSERIPLDVPGIDEPFQFMAPAEVTASLSYTQMLLAGDMTPGQIVASATQIVRDCIVGQERFRAQASVAATQQFGQDADSTDIEWSLKLLTFERLMRAMKVRGNLTLEIDDEDLASIDPSIHSNPIVRLGLTLTRIYSGGFPTEQPGN